MIAHHRSGAGPAALGGNLTTAMVAIGIGSAPAFICSARSSQVSASEVRGSGPRWVTARVMLKHVFPNMIGPLLVQTSIAIAAAILAETALSFLGLGVQPPTPSWGSILRIGTGYMQQAPWLSIYPGLSIFVTVLGINLLGDGLRDVLDPRDRA